MRLFSLWLVGVPRAARGAVRRLAERARTRRESSASEALSSEGYRERKQRRRDGRFQNQDPATVLETSGRTPANYWLRDSVTARQVSFGPRHWR